MDKTFLVHAYIRKSGELIQSKYISVLAPCKDLADRKVQNFFASIGLCAGINGESTVELTDFASLANTYREVI